MAANFKIKPSLVSSHNTPGYRTEAYSEMMRRIADRSYEIILEVVSQSLDRAKGEYIDGLKFYQISKNQYNIEVTGNAAFLEKGYPSYDMKPGLLEHGFISDSGARYNVIPMNLGPNSAITSEDVKTSSDSMLAKRSSILQKFKGTSGGASTSGSINTATIPHNLKGSKNRDSMLSGSYGDTVFRTVSENSDNGSWIHPGFGGVRAFDFLDSVLDEVIEDVADEILDQVIGQLF